MKDIREFIKEKSLRIRLKKSSDINLFKKWCKLVGECKRIEEVTASELNSRLSSCFVTIRKSNGEEYDLEALHRCKEDSTDTSKRTGFNLEYWWIGDLKSLDRPLKHKEEKLKEERKGIKT